MKPLGTEPFAKEKLAIFVLEGIRMSAQSFKAEVRQESKGQGFSKLPDCFKSSNKVVLLGALHLFET